MLKIAVFDIETWDLGAEFGPLVCASVLLLPENKMVTFRQDSYLRRKKAADMTDDRALLCDLRDLLDSRHLSIGWFSKGFDRPHINTRLAMHGECMLKAQLHIDPIWYYKGWRGLKTKTAKLKHVSEFFHFEEKPEVPPEVWLKARGGNRKAIDEVVERCEADTRITAQIAKRTLDLGLVRNIQIYP